jgi:hypothetical protein
MNDTSPRKITVALAFGSCIYLPFVIGWYASLPHRSALADIAPYVGLAVAGAAVGWIRPRRFAITAVALGLLLPPLTALVHWGSCHFDQRLDVCGLQEIMTIEMFLLPAAIGLCAIGAWCGAKMRK